ncbi:helix-turn-helix transcriptional regulator [Marinilabilia sp.]|uniref:AraC family transcriptional regulator n=1 Tax=Marinilabilia sp. TaxID=2021252 RepID=UPI0025BED5F0|nr:helix-turn-helix transcriptional regulator [Marinilabilia sp.]
MESKIITDYGRVLRKGSIKTIVDLDESLKIDFSFQLHSIHDLVNEFEGIMPPNRISHNILAFIKNGSGEKIIGNHRFRIHPNLGLIFPKNIIHSTNKWSLDTSGYMLSFNESLFEEHHFPVTFLQLPTLFKLSTIPYRPFNKFTSQKVQTLFEELKLLQNAIEPGDRKIFILKLSELIVIYQKEFVNNKAIAKNANCIFDKFVDFVEAKFKKTREVKFYATLLSVHPNHLNKIVRASSKMSAKEYIHHRIINEAKYLLSATSIPMKEIAFELGFADYIYFSRLFKRLVEQTPVHYRKYNT